MFLLRGKFCSGRRCRGEVRFSTAPRWVGPPRSQPAEVSVAHNARLCATVSVHQIQMHWKTGNSRSRQAFTPGSLGPTVSPPRTDFEALAAARSARGGSVQHGDRQVGEEWWCDQSNRIVRAVDIGGTAAQQFHYGLREPEFAANCCLRGMAEHDLSNSVGSAQADRSSFQSRRHRPGIRRCGHLSSERSSNFGTSALRGEGHRLAAPTRARPRSAHPKLTNSVKSGRTVCSSRAKRPWSLKQRHCLGRAAARDGTASPPSGRDAECKRLVPAAHLRRSFSRHVPPHPSARV